MPTTTVEVLESRRLLAVTLASQSTAGAFADAGAGSIGASVMSPVISDDGRFVVFVSESGNLAANDGNDVADVFVRDGTTNETRLVSAAPDGSAGNGASGSPGAGTARTGYAISGNGRYVVFASDASNLTEQPDTNGLPDYFVRDLQTNTTSLVTVTPAGGYSITSTAGGTAGRPAISDDGRFIAFTATYSDLDQDANDPDDNAADVFVRDMAAGTTRQLTRTFDGEIGSGAVGSTPSISSDGNYIAFTSNDELLAGGPGGFIFEQVWVFDMMTGTVVNASVGPDRTTYAAADSFLPQISGNGRSVVFHSSAPDLIAGFVDNNGDGGGANGVDAADLFLRDLDSGTTTLVSRAAGSTTAGASDLVRAASISADGRFVAYVSRATNLVSGISDTNDDNGNVGGEDVFYFDATTEQTQVLSLNASGTATGAKPSLEPDGAPDAGPAMSDDGRYVVFASEADDLVANDTNVSAAELFVRDTQSNMTRRLFDGLSLAPASIATSPAISGNGNAIAFVGNGQGIVGTDVIGEQVFVDDQLGGGGGNNLPELGSLAPTLFTEFPDAVVAGARVKGASAVVNITNVDPENFNGPVTLTLFASLDSTLDPAVDAQIMTVRKKLRIDSAQAKTVRLRIASFPQVPDGDYVTLVQVHSDAAGTGFTSNGETINIAAPFIDLSGTTFGAFPTTPLVRGKRARLSLTVLNSGNVNAKATVPVTIAVSPDPGGASPTTLATINAKVNLKPGASRAVRLNFALPSETSDGTFFVVAAIDPANALAERNETNNTLVSAGTLSIA